MSFLPVPIEDYSGSMKAISWEHHEIHDGDVFRYYDSVTLGSAVSQDYLIQTPATGKLMHLTASADGTAITSFFMYEGTDKSGTTPQTFYNAYRDSANPSTATIHKGTSGGTTDGTLISRYASGAATAQSRSSSNVNHDNEWVLKLNTKYIFRITSGTAGNLCNIMFDWYEHAYGT